MLHTSGLRAAATALALAAATAVLPALPLVEPAAAQTEQGSPLTEALARRSGGTVTIERDEVTGAVTFVGTPPGEPITTPRESSGGPEAAAGAFVDEFGALFGATDTARLEQSDVTPRLDGGATVTYQQVVDDVPVVGGELRVQTDDERDVLSALGELQPALDVGTTPTIDAATATDRAVTAIAAVHAADATALTATEPTLAIFAPDLIGGPSTGSPRLTWRLDVTGPDTPEPFRELVLIDATSGAIALHFDQVAAGLDRTVCNRQNVVDDDPTCVEPFARTEGSEPTLDADVDKAYEYAGDTYDYFAERFGRDSLDGEGMPLVSTVRFCPPDDDCPYPNAFWDGHQMAYGETYSQADDIVAHELTHGFTQHTSGLFYYFQSGAINESISDVFGELIDLTNVAGTDTAAVRLLIGEDLPDVGAFRSLRNPAQFGQPGKMTSGLYVQDVADNGGVHTNSGVGNKAAALIIDGGAVGTTTIAGIGTDKAARLYYEVATTLLGSGSDYRDLASALPQACENLVGTDGFVAADCDQVRSAVAMVDMTAVPTTAPVSQAPDCPADAVPQTVFTDDLEDPGSGNWAIAGTGTAQWAYPQNPNAAAVPLDATYATSGTTNFFVPVTTQASDSTITRTSDLTLPGSSRLYFETSFEYPGAGDAALVEYSTDEGGTWLDAAALSTTDGYSGPMTGVSNGYGSRWIDLGALSGPSFRFRFRAHTSGSGLGLGWFVDDVRVVSCEPHFGQPDLAIRSGANGSLAGVDVLNATGVGQKIKATVGRLGSTTFRVIIENQGVIPDTVRISGATLTPAFRFRYYDGAHEITNELASWTTPELAPGETHQIKVVATARGQAHVGSNAVLFIRGFSVTTGSHLDVVRAKALRNR